jgi:hypothetical protein
LGSQQELFSSEQWKTLRHIAETRPLDRESLADFDDTIEGPSMRRLVDRRYEGAPSGFRPGCRSLCAR